jgi:hypothetical protein
VNERPSEAACTPGVPQLRPPGLRRRTHLGVRLYSSYRGGDPAERRGGSSTMRRTSTASACRGIVGSDRPTGLVILFVTSLCREGAAMESLLQP